VKWSLLLTAATVCCLRADVQKQPSPAVSRAPLATEAPQSALEKRVVELNSQAVESGRAGDYRGAAAVLEQARSLCAPPSGARPGLYASVLANLADADEQLGNWEQAIALLHQAVSADEKDLGASHLSTSRMRVKLASALVVVGNFADAEPLLVHAIGVQRSGGPENRFELALSLTSLALLQINLNRPEEAEQNASEAVALARMVNTENADYASMLGVLGSAYVIEGRRARALPLLNDSIALLEKTLSPGHNRVAPVLMQRGLLEAGDHKYTLAEQDMNRAITILDRTGGDGGANGDWARFRLARVYMEEKKLADADAILPVILDRQRRFLGGANPRLAVYVRELARLRALEKRWDEAGSLYREAIALAAAQPGSATAGTRETAALLSSDRPAREKDVRRLEQRANEIFGFRSAE
jgi:tetratricopeptide (TPR) repeat protein